MIRPFSILHSPRFSISCIAFKKYLPFSPQQSRHLSTTTTAAKDNSFRDVVPYRPHGTRASQQKNPRRSWTKEEDDCIKELYAQHGPKYTLISQQLGRSVSSVFHRCRTLYDPQYKMKRRPWEKEELDALRTLVEQATGTTSHQQKTGTMINWRAIQQRLPYARELTNIKLTWYHSINPQWQRGRWTQEETARLQQLIQQYGIEDWRHISLLLQTRSPRQCLEKYRHTIAVERKGRFTPQEDAALKTAVDTFGATDFLHIQRILASPRTPRQLAKRYHYALDPHYDRSSPWLDTEKHDMYRLALQYDRNMVKVKALMNSKRRINDMWNQFFILHRSKKTEAATMDDDLPSSGQQHGNMDRKGINNNNNNLPR